MQNLFNTLFMTLVYFAKCSIADRDDFVRPFDTEKAERHERNKMTVSLQTHHGNLLVDRAKDLHIGK